MATPGSLALSGVFKFPWHLAPNYERLAGQHQVRLLANASSEPGGADRATQWALWRPCSFLLEFKAGRGPCYPSALTPFHRLAVRAASLQPVFQAPIYQVLMVEPRTSRASPEIPEFLQWLSSLTSWTLPTRHQLKPKSLKWKIQVFMTCAMNGRS